MSKARKAQKFNAVIERDSEGFYFASVPALRGCHTQARTMDQLIERIREAIELCLEAQGGEIEVSEFIGVQCVEV